MSQTLLIFADACPTLATIGRINPVEGATDASASTPKPGTDSMDSLADFYYRGIPSCPRLVYRSGRTPWGGPHRPKELRPVYNHLLNTLWDHVGPELYKLLDSQRVLWTTIDVVRFIEGDSKTPGPPTVWVGVLPGSLRTEDASLSAHTCLTLLNRFGVTDVEIEFRESVYTRLANAHLYGYPTEGPIASVVGPLTPILGLSIAALETPYIEGTGALYLAESKESQKILLLTARHVILHRDNCNASFSSASSSSPIKVLLLGTRSYENLVKSITEELDRNKDTSAIRRHQALLDRRGTGHDLVWEAAAALGRRRRAVQALEVLLAEVKDEWGSVEDRVIGHVVQAPPIALGVGDKQFTQDYAIVELDASRFTDAFQGNPNVIDLGTQIPQESFEKKMHPSKDDNAPERFIYPNQGLLRLQGIIAEEDLHRPKMQDEAGEPCLLVIKNGKSTGVTIGRATGIISYTREYFADNTQQTSREWAIHSYDKNSGVFSAAGDSGSVIVDGSGRIGGVLTGGSRNSLIASIDITYATPFFWLLQQIKENGYPNAYPL